MSAVHMLDRLEPLQKDDTDPDPDALLFFDDGL